jgi:hypothetical protein
MIDESQSKPRVASGRIRPSEPRGYLVGDRGLFVEASAAAPTARFRWVPSPAALMHLWLRPERITTLTIDATRWSDLSLLKLLSMRLPGVPVIGIINIDDLDLGLALLESEQVHEIVYRPLLSETLAATFVKATRLRASAA